VIRSAKIHSFGAGNAFLAGVLLLAFLSSSCGMINGITGQKKDEKFREREQNRALIKKYEDVIGTRISMKKSLALYKAIDKWMGVPYKYGSMSRKGTDCSGFTCNIYDEVYHIKLHRGTDDQYYKDIRKIGKRRLKEGDLVFFNIEHGKKVSHVGIYLGNHKFVHASVKKGVCISNLDEKYYTDHFRHGGRVKKTFLTGNTINGV
jgi:murein DD-endopeptidase / murein LD-carboxypeptidase